jgi:transposase
MDHFARLDVSVKETNVCIVDETGKIVREVKLASEPDALVAAMKNLAYHFKRIGLEAGLLSQWLFSALAEAGLPVICVETRHMRAVLKAQINKTDRNDARGIAQMMRVELYRSVHVIPSTATRAVPYPLDRAVYRRRNLIERLFCRLMNWRRLATRYDPLARNYLAALALIAVVTEWL